MKAFAVTDRSSGNPTTLVTVVVLPSRLVLAQGANVDRDAALKLLAYVDFAAGRGGEVTARRGGAGSGPAARAGRTGRAWPSSTASSRASRSCRLPNEAEAARLAAMIFDENGERSRRSSRSATAAIEGMAIFWEGLGSSFRARPFLFLEDLVVGGGRALGAAWARRSWPRSPARASRRGACGSTGPSSTGT